MGKIDLKKLVFIYGLGAGAKISLSTQYVIALMVFRKGALCFVRKKPSFSRIP